LIITQNNFYDGEKPLNVLSDMKRIPWNGPRPHFFPMWFEDTIKHPPTLTFDVSAKLSISPINMECSLHWIYIAYAGSSVTWSQQVSGCATFQKLEGHRDSSECGVASCQLDSHLGFNPSGAGVKVYNSTFSHDHGVSSKHHVTSMWQSWIGKWNDL